MINDPSPLKAPPMRQTLPSSDILMGRRTLRQLAERLELVEDLWRTVLRSECPPDQAERLLKLKQLCDEEETSKEIIRLIVEMDLAEAIAAARAFSLYFQLVNILEQHKIGRAHV